MFEVLVVWAGKFLWVSQQGKVFAGAPLIPHSDAALCNSISQPQPSFCFPHVSPPMRTILRRLQKTNRIIPFLHESIMTLQTETPLQHMAREQLSELLLSSDTSKIAVIDVRGDDHVGGHIRTSMHVPSSSLDHRIPELVRKLSNKEMVIFHCALSQERGPRAARRYLEERAKKLKSGEVDKLVGAPGIEIKDGSIQKDTTGLKEQEVFVLDQGFVGWQEKYAFEVS